MFSDECSHNTDETRLFPCYLRNCKQGWDDVLFWATPLIFWLKQSLHQSRMQRQLLTLTSSALFYCYFVVTFSIYLLVFSFIRKEGGPKQLLWKDLAFISVRLFSELKQDSPPIQCKQSSLVSAEYASRILGRTNTIMEPWKAIWNITIFASQSRCTPLNVFHIGDRRLSTVEAFRQVFTFISKLFPKMVLVGHTKASCARWGFGNKKWNTNSRLIAALRQKYITTLYGIFILFVNQAVHTERGNTTCLTWRCSKTLLLFSVLLRVYPRIFKPPYASYTYACSFVLYRTCVLIAS